MKFITLTISLLLITHLNTYSAASADKAPAPVEYVIAGNTYKLLCTSQGTLPSQPTFHLFRNTQGTIRPVLFPSNLSEDGTPLELTASPYRSSEELLAETRITHSNFMDTPGDNQSQMLITAHTNSNKVLQQFITNMEDIISLKQRGAQRSADILLQKNAAQAHTVNPVELAAIRELIARRRDGAAKTPVLNIIEFGA